jgi:glycosyltransferase involved in cell wall biosynthesis
VNIGFLLFKEALVSGGYLYDKRLIDYLRKKGDTVQVLFLLKEKIIHANEMDVVDLFCIIQEKNIDLLLQDELCHPSLSYFNSYWKQNTTIPLVSVVHNLSTSLKKNNQDREKTACGEKHYLQTVDHFIFISKSVKQEAEKLVQHAMAGVIAWPGKDHLCYQTEKEYAKYSSQQVFHLLFIGNLYPYKGLHVLINALAQIPTEKWTLTVLGDTAVNPQYTRLLQTALKKLHLKDHVQFEGVVSPEKVSWFLRHAHLVVVPSFYESFGLVYVEALGFGVPVLAAKNGGASEFITEGKDGFFVEFENIRQLKEKILFFIQHPSEWNSMKKNALEKFQGLPTWDMSMENIWLYLHGL